MTEVVCNIFTFVLVAFIENCTCMHIVYCFRLFAHFYLSGCVCITGLFLLSLYVTCGGGTWPYPLKLLIDLMRYPVDESKYNYNQMWLLLHVCLKKNKGVYVLKGHNQKLQQTVHKAFSCFYNRSTMRTAILWRIAEID